MPTSPASTRALRRTVLPALAGALALALAACGGGGGGGGDREGSSAQRDAEPFEPGTWTVLQYSMADTDLEPFMVEDVNELAAVEVGEQLHVRAFVDRAEAYGDDELLDQGSWVGAKVLDI